MWYRLVRWLARIVLRWYYRDVEVVGRERIPSHGPVLLAVNHFNALIDALVVMRVAPRQVRLTAKATLFGNPIARLALRSLGIIPLRRAADEAKRGGGKPVDAGRNAAAFAAIVDSLAAGSTVLIFPEGISHNEPALAPLRTGLARLALQARDERGVRDLRILPIGLTFEEKWQPRSRIFVHVGEPIALDGWRPTHSGEPVADLTTDVANGLRATTLNFATADEAAWVFGVSHILAGIFEPVRPVGRAAPALGDAVDLARRVLADRHVVARLDPERSARFLTRVDAFREQLARLGIAPHDVRIARGILPGARFAVREGAILLGPGLTASWGRINHWTPIAVARAVARRFSHRPDDPATYTLAIAVVLVSVAYAVQTALVWHWAGARWALVYLVTLPLAGLWDQRFRDRLREAGQRMRTYLRFRADPSLQERLASELAWLREEAIALDALAAAHIGENTGSSAGALTPAPAPSAAEGSRPPDPSATRRV